MATALIDWCYCILGDAYVQTYVQSGLHCMFIQAYSPPEVLDQDNSDDIVEVSPKADVWALGE
jgi:hypothetical protein